MSGPVSFDQPDNNAAEVTSLDHMPPLIRPENYAMRAFHQTYHLVSWVIYIIKVVSEMPEVDTHDLQFDGTVN